ncbi:hypothetical protein [Amycolatopsis sp. CA-230715]|uniref:hypothetical protein n=1 Tax=Amycolatopsis sp. CA-230715 TaxID=2745196 RepID=UPI001C0371C4|nr:hypothetical protein [Amycolatopsis sp. CA-230715]
MIEAMCQTWLVTVRHTPGKTATNVIAILRYEPSQRREVTVTLDDDDQPTWHINPCVLRGEPDPSSSAHAWVRLVGPGVWQTVLRLPDVDFELAFAAVDVQHVVEQIARVDRYTAWDRGLGELSELT